MEGPPWPGPEDEAEALEDHPGHLRERRQLPGDGWQSVGQLDIIDEDRGKSASHPWTGRTIVVVDKKDSKEYEAEHRRQRVTVANYTNELT